MPNLYGHTILRGSRGKLDTTLSIFERATQLVGGHTPALDLNYLGGSAELVFLDE